MKTYIGTKIVTAEPETHEDGRPGYRVVYADGYASWSPKGTFVTAYREITWHERQLIEQTDAEHQVSAISDGEPPYLAVQEVCDMFVAGQYSPTWHEIVCKNCGNLRGSHNDDMSVTEEADTRCLDTVEKVDVWNQDHPLEKAKLGDTVRIRW